MSEQVVTAHDGIELAVRDHGGDGPDVVFVHGVMRTLEDWAPVLHHLSGVRAVALDLRYHGRSGTPQTPHWDDFVRDIATIADELALSNPFVVGHSFGGVIAMAYAAAHPDCPGAVNIEGFNFRERALFDDVDPAEVDRFLDDFRRATSCLSPDAGDGAWIDEQREMQRRMDEELRIPDEVSAATLDRVFVRTADGWTRRPSNRFFDLTNAAEEWANPLEILRAVTQPMTFVVCRPPGETGMYAAARDGLERHIRTISERQPNVRLETFDASHFVIFEKPAEIAALVSSLVAYG